jgi:serine/threonine-protein kinase
VDRALTDGRLDRTTCASVTESRTHDGRVTTGGSKSDVRLTLGDPSLPTMDLSLGSHPAPGARISASVRIGDTIDGQYRVAGVLGSGGMGTVYLAEDPRLGRDVAIKLIHEDLLAHDHVRADFLREARAMARVNHPNVVTIHAFGEHEGQPYLVMERVEGESLATVLRTRGRLGWREAMAVVDPLCRGVQAIHDAGAVHRDLKPGNVLFDEGGRLAITDFGLSRPRDVVVPEERVGFLCGTPGYIAPEVARESAIDPTFAHGIDVYALGVIAFELLTGMHPFDAPGVPQMLFAHAHQEPPTPSAVAEDLPTAFDAPLLAALRKSPGARTRSADDLREALATAAQQAEQFPRGLKILLVDDDAETLQILGELIELTFPIAQVHRCTDITSAAAVAARERPNLVVTDLQMPNGGGAQLTAALRDDPRTASIPIVVVTGQGGAADWERLRALGADRFLVKPLAFDALAATIRSLAGPPPRVHARDPAPSG